MQLIAEWGSRLQCVLEVVTSVAFESSARNSNSVFYGKIVQNEINTSQNCPHLKIKEWNKIQAMSVSTIIFNSREIWRWCITGTFGIAEFFFKLFLSFGILKNTNFCGTLSSAKRSHPFTWWRKQVQFRKPCVISEYKKMLSVQWQRNIELHTLLLKHPKLFSCSSWKWRLVTTHFSVTLQMNLKSMTLIKVHPVCEPS
jgi:hypothetical protein